MIDVHCHFTLTQRVASLVIERFSFEPAMFDGRAAMDSCVAPRLMRQWKWWFLRRLMGVPTSLSAGDALDAELQRFYDKHLLADGPINRYVLLAFDHYHDDCGRIRLPSDRDDDLSGDIYTSNSCVRDLCRRRPDRFLFGASIHPYRPDASGAAREVFAAGACLVKWLPLHQNIDVADPRTRDFMRTCAEIGLPLLVHYGEEFTLATQHAAFQSVRPLLAALRELRREGRMPTVIVAHVSTPVWITGETDSYEALVDALLGEFASLPLYADISALTAMSKHAFLRKVAARQELHSKLLFGSDFPIPVGLCGLRMTLGRAYNEIANLPSWPQQAARVCQHMGFNEIVFQQADRVLANT